MYNFSDAKRRMDDHEKHPLDCPKSSRSRDKHERNKVQKNKTEKDRSPGFNYRYILVLLNPRRLFSHK